MHSWHGDEPFETLYVPVEQARHSSPAGSKLWFAAAGGINVRRVKLVKPMLQMQYLLPGADEAF